MCCLSVQVLCPVDSLPLPHALPEMISKVFIVGLCCALAVGQNALEGRAALPLGSSSCPHWAPACAGRRLFSLDIGREHE